MNLLPEGNEEILHRRARLRQLHKDIIYINSSFKITKFFLSAHADSAQ